MRMVEREMDGSEGEVESARAAGWYFACSVSFPDLVSRNVRKTEILFGFGF